MVGYFSIVKSLRPHGRFVSFDARKSFSIRSAYHSLNNKSTDCLPAISTRARKHGVARMSAGVSFGAYISSLPIWSQSSSVRYYGSSASKSKNKLNLMDLEPSFKPKLFTEIKSRVAHGPLIRHYDPEFTWEEFQKGTMEAVYLISNLLSQGDLDGLSGIVDQEAVMKIKENYQYLSDSDRKFLAVEEGDIINTYTCWTGLMMPGEKGGQQRFVVDIMSGFHGGHGFQEGMKYCMENIREHEDMPSVIEQLKKKFQLENNYCLNYLFRREMTKGVEDSWTVHQLDHFRMKDYFQEGDLWSMLLIGIIRKYLYRQ